MSKIIHFSDIHLGHKKNSLDGIEDTAVRFDSIVKNLLELIPQEDRENYTVLITGDIIDFVTDENLNTALAFLSKLRKAFKVVIVPGNHDFSMRKWGIIRYKNSLRLAKKFLKAIYGSEHVDFPFVEYSKKEDIAFICLNSLEKEIVKPWWDIIGGDGRLGEEQINRIEELCKNDEKLKSAQYRAICLHHHPWDRYKFQSLKDTNLFKETINRINKNILTIDAVLYGHKHNRNGAFNSNYFLSIRRCYDAGSTTRKNGDPGYHRLIDLSTDPLYDFDLDLHGPYGKEVDEKLFV
jgi:3',5'-cyclic AMP phosphodiesterase CpdA